MDRLLSILLLLFESILHSLKGTKGDIALLLYFLSVFEVLVLLLLLELGDLRHCGRAKSNRKI